MMTFLLFFTLQRKNHKKVFWSPVSLLTPKRQISDVSCSDKIVSNESDRQRLKRNNDCNFLLHAVLFVTSERKKYSGLS